MSIADPIANAIYAAIKPALDARENTIAKLSDDLRADVAKIAKEAAQAAIDAMPAGKALTLEIKALSGEISEIDGAHASLPELIAAVNAGFVNVLMVGPAGSGKTTIARDLARALKRPFGHIALSGGTSESALTGRAIPNLATGAVTFQTTAFVTIYENGGVYLLDEVDAADPNVLLVLNAAIANGHMPVPNRTENPTATRHPECIILAAANTYGTGADRQYVGRNQLDAAFLDRFVGATLEVDYDRALEAQLAPKAVCDAVWAVRDRIATLKMRRIFGTRALVATAKWVTAGQSLKAAISKAQVGWSADEIARVRVAVDA